VSLFAGAAPGTVGADEGISCASCHSIRNGPTNAEGYVVEAPARYFFESSSSAPARTLSGFLIRAYPRHHRDSFTAPVLKASEACASCHQQLVEAQADRAGLLRIQNQYDQWRTSKWNRLDPKATVECRDCHMPLLDGSDAAAGAAWRPGRNPEGRHRSH
jgi:cytochrome c peroxidase